MNEAIKNTNPENTPNKTEWDNLAETDNPAHVVMENKRYGIEIVDVREINIDSQEGRLDYLTSLVENARSVKSERLNVLENGFYDHIREAEPIFSDFSDGEISSLEDDTREDLETINAQKTILENLDFSSSSVIQALKAKTAEYQKKMLADGMSEEAAEKFALLHKAADNLYMIMVDEVRRRKQEKGDTQPEHQEVGAQSSPDSYTLDDITLVVGQEIPDDWFESRSNGQKTDSGFGITVKQPPRIDGYLQLILNVEYSKINEDERKYYNFSSIMKKIKEEAQTTKKIPDIATIMESKRIAQE